MKRVHRKIPLTLLSLFLIVLSNPICADECSFIREQLQTLPASGGEIIIPPGLYTCLGPIILDRSNTHLRGLGDVTLHLGKNINSPVIVMGDTATPPRPIFNVSVTHLKIDGNRWF